MGESSDQKSLQKMFKNHLTTDTALFINAGKLERRKADREPS
jgi:hypothetical protein